MTANRRKGLNSVRYINNPVAHPDNVNKKAMQAGRFLTVPRARPTFCTFCDVRHSDLNPADATNLAVRTLEQKMQAMQKAAL